jgi:hypothetical protein
VRRKQILVPESRRLSFSVRSPSRVSYLPISAHFSLLQSVFPRRMPFWKSKTNRTYTYAARHVRRRTHFSVRRLLISALVGFSAAARPKELAHDYLEREQSTDPTLVAGLVVAEWEKTRKPEQAPSASPANDLESRQNT